ncbi:hypothetical protein D9758_007207 [Tetrapyrgos nigripes]|uniref:FAD-dependent oxidoreductase 2 FAD-binding domain-containing protein n=1 Tax=Tetrapyrgos nigripes TaxID=182062 RepID=A0A8H5D1W7_9AGAR|nr:hypothetical protein D9758_007207 [Tetrapyrgos nigripes]
MSNKYDCICIGSGNAGCSAALSAIHNGCNRVLILEKSPTSWAGGNGYFTAGGYRTTHTGLSDLLPIVTNVQPNSEQANKIDMDPYTREDFIGDIMRLSGERSDERLVGAMVDGSRDAIQWLKDKVNVPFIFSFHRQAYEVDGRQKFWGGMVLSVEDGGKGLIEAHHRALKEAGVEIWFDSPAVELLFKDGVITGVVTQKDGQHLKLETPAVVLAAGGFEADPAMRMKYLGQEWGNAKVRGTPYNTGDGFTLASPLNPKVTSNWSAAGCHSTCWDYHTSSSSGSRSHTNTYTKSGYPLGLMINSTGQRFVDEGEDYRNYTYAKFGREILRQPGGYVFQVYDGKVLGMLRKEEYGDGVVRKIYADSVEELAAKLVEEGLEEAKVPTFIGTVNTYNQAVATHRQENPHLKWDPAIKDDMSTQSSQHSLQPPKSNWALPLDEKPFMAVKVTCGITFTFGGLAIDPETAGVLSEVGKSIEGLFCTGEMVGGLFHGNYPGGSGLTAGTVFGRKAGKAAAQLRKQ